MSYDARDPEPEGRRNEGHSEPEERAEASARRIAAAAAGALEGFVEALDRHDVAAEAERAVQEAGAIARAASGASPAAEGGVSSSHVARETARLVKADVAARVRAVAESGRRARMARRILGHEISQVFRSWRRSWLAAAAMGGALVLFLVTGLVVFTIALVVASNEIIGDPLGTFVVAFLFIVAAGLAHAVAKSMHTRSASERKERYASAREEMRHVARPARGAFSRGKPGA